MNRIYQGKVSNVQKLKAGAKGTKPEDWEDFDPDPAQAKARWQASLWQHHQLFQDAVNYCLAAFAAMAKECEPSTLPAKFRASIIGMWPEYKGRKGEWNHPFGKVCLLVTGKTDSSFEEFEARLLKLACCESTPTQHAEAMHGLTARMVTGDVEKDAKPSDCWRDVIDFAAAFTNQAGRVEENQQRRDAQGVAKLIANSPTATLKLEEVFLFKATPGFGKNWDAKKTAAELRARFKALAATYSHIAKRGPDFNSWMNSEAATLSLPGPGGKTQAPFDAALLLHLLKWPELREVFLELTSKLRDEELPTITSDSSKAVRVAGKPVFPAFTNLAIAQKGKPKQFSWASFDKVAGIEALTKYQQFCRDCQERDDEKIALSARKLSFETRGTVRTPDAPESIPGFEGDTRKSLLEELLVKLGGERLDEKGKPLPYRVRRNTLKAWGRLRERWLELRVNGEPTEANLNAVRRKLQKSKKDSFGSAELFILLAKPEYQAVWKDKPAQEWHAKDLLEAWAAYDETCEDLERTERKINFTPAHEAHSPRYFCWSETNNHKHLPWQRNNAFQVECDIPLNDPASDKICLQKVQIHFFAPRLLRDSLRFQGEALDSEHPDASWLPAAYRARPELVAAAKEQTFAGTSVRLSPGYDVKGQFRALLDFAVEIQTKGLQHLWSSWRPHGKNFGHGMKDDDDVYRFLAWPKPGKEKAWCSRHKFHCLSADLGLRRPAAWAILQAQTGITSHARKIGTADGKDWFAVPTAMGVLRLPGEDARVFRKPSKKEAVGFDPTKPHEEFWGSSGRPSSSDEASYAEKTLREIETLTQYSLKNLPDNWKTEFSYPEQNDELVRALRYLRSRIRMFHRWGWLLTQEDRKTDTLADIADSNVSDEWKGWAQAGESEKLYAAIKTDAVHLTAILKERLIVVVNRAMLSPRHSLRWKESGGWVSLEEVEDKSRQKMDCASQRGISLKRIQQLLYLRELCQSLNKLSHREFGKATKVERGVETPESCRQILGQLEELREQRVNQIANGLFCLALGVRRVARTQAALAKRLGIKLADSNSPTKQEAELIEARCREQDLHGVYEPIPERQPVDFIVLEELEGFRMSSVRSRRDNRTLASWCHRQIVKKLEELCQPLQIPILKVRAKDTSRFCSRSGAPGFRAVEVRTTDERFPRWAEAFADSQQSDRATELFEWLKLANAGINERKRERTLLAPQFLGSKFVALAKQENDTKTKAPSVDNADVGAAVTIGLRALGHPDEWQIHPERWNLGVEPQNPTRKKLAKSFGNGNKVKEQPYYADFSESLAGGKRYKDFPAPILPSKCFWDLVEDQSWPRCRAINAARMREWGFQVEDHTPQSAASPGEDDNVPM